MSRVYFVLIAAMASLCGKARADVTLSLPLVSAKVGATVSVTCTVTGETFLGWFNPSGNKITTSRSANIRVESSGNKHKIKFVDVKVSFGSNKYQCRGSSKTKTLIVHVAFNIDKVDKIQHIRIGNVDRIKLGIAGYPKPTYTWKKDGKKLNPASDRRLSVLVDGSLKIDKVVKSDRGNYTCVVEQSGLEQDAEIEVYAVELPKIKPFSVPRRYLTQGYPASFICEATGIPAPKCKWLSPDGNQINSIGNVQVNGCNLTFTSVDVSFTKGKYTCVAFIEIEETGEEIAQASAIVEVVDVFVAPKIDPTQGIPVSLKRGDDYKLKCVATGNPLPDVTWRKDGVIDPRQQQTKGQSIIEFKNIQVQDGGEYICEASNTAVDNDGNTIVKNLSKTINIESKPFIITLASPQKVYSYLGNSDPTWVRCKFGGYPEPFVTMRFKEKLMSNASTVAEKKLFTNAKKDFGSYKCHAKNKFGSTNYTIELKLAEAPTEVENLQAKASCKSIELTWERPKQDGGMPINKYVLTYSSTTLNINGDETSYIIRDLKHNTEYSITLRATSKAEWGPPVSLNKKTEEHCAPGRPVIYSPESTLLTTDSFTLKWRRPEETGGDDDITYTVRYRVEKDNKKGPWITHTTKGLQYDFSDLDNKVQYKFEVKAKNQGGESLPGEKYIQTNFPGERSLQIRLVSSVFLTIFAGGFLLLL